MIIISHHIITPESRIEFSPQDGLLKIEGRGLPAAVNKQISNKKSRDEHTYWLNKHADKHILSIVALVMRH